MEPSPGQPAGSTIMKEVHCASSQTTMSSYIGNRTTGELTLRLPISLVTKKWLSTSDVVIEDFRWKLFAQVKESDILHLQMECNGDYMDSNLWVCKATYEMGVMSNDGEMTNSFEGTKDFWSDSISATSHVKNWNSIKSDAKLIKDDHITVKSTISIHNHAGIRKFTPLNFYNPTPHSDVVLKVGEERFHVNKAILATQSPFFESLFFSKFSEKDKEEITLLDIDSKKFSTFLHFVYQSGYSVTENNYLYLLELADMFQVTTLLKACEDFLSINSRCKDLESLRLADKYALPRVVTACMETFKDSGTVKTFTKQKGFKNLSPYTQLEIFNKLNQF